MKIPDTRTCTALDVVLWLDTHPSDAELVAFLEENDGNGSYRECELTGDRIPRDELLMSVTDFILEV